MVIDDFALEEVSLGFLYSLTHATLVKCLKLFKLIQEQVLIVP